MALMGSHIGLGNLIYLFTDQRHVLCRVSIRWFICSGTFVKDSTELSERVQIEISHAMGRLSRDFPLRAFNISIVLFSCWIFFVSRSLIYTKLNKKYLINTVQYFNRL